MDSNIFCPLIDAEINICDCSENRDVREEAIPQRFKEKENWKEICKNCKYQEF